MIMVEKHTGLWGGRFTQAPSELSTRFSSSLTGDFEFVQEDILGSIAHATMLGDCDIISVEEATLIASSLYTIAEELRINGLPTDIECEDVHSLVEMLLVRKIGDVGKKLHTARSRNDQIALDERLYLKRAVAKVDAMLAECSASFVRKAEDSLSFVMPGYTHLQHAQPVLLSHHLLAYVEMFERDRSRLSDAMARADVSPLGAAALSGTSFPIDRVYVANKIGFAGISANSIDSVSDRDYLIEIISACSITMMHLSRFAEECVLWSSSEFNFVNFPDSLTTGSSIMPQKRNPDMAELIRGKTGRVYGALVSILTTMKALPLAYNRDMQEDKQPMFEALATTTDCIRMATELITGAVFNAASMRAQLATGFLTATELADYLSTKGMPFRIAHEVTGAIVSHCERENLQLHELPLKTLVTFSPLIEADVYDALNPIRALERKRSAGSTSTAEVQNQITKWKSRFSKKS
jgi:argininosuccinate lyase